MSTINIGNILDRESIKIASNLKRCLAFIIDSVIYSLIILIFMFFAITYPSEYLSKIGIGLNIYDILYFHANLSSIDSYIDSNIIGSSIAIAYKNNVISDLLFEFLIKLLFILTFCLIYEIIFTNFFGATIGKMICKIKIIDIRTIDNPSFLLCIVRAILKFIIGYSFFIPFLFAFGDDYKRTIYDKLSKTIVIDRDINIE